MDYEPKNTSDILYLKTNIPYTLDDLLDRIKDHFPGVPMEELVIRSESIHTRCVTYDRYEPMDYDNFIIVEKV